MSVTENDSELKKKINDCYIRVFERPADLDGLQSNYNQIKNGNLTIEQLYLLLKQNKSRGKKLDFFRKISSPLRILPDFLIIGEHKCGTTSLFEYMLEHPCILSPTIKEPNYFNRHYEKGTLWYKKHFPTFLSKLYCQNKNKNKVITGEATTHYLFAKDEITYRIKKLLPSTKIIVILRNPIERAYSQYSMFVSEGRENLSFEDAIEREKQIINKKIKQVNFPKYSRLHPSYTYLRRGIYVDNLRRWMNIFPKEQFLILQTEEFNSKPNEVLNHVYKFLNLEPWTNKNFEKHNVGKYNKMNPNTRKKLIEFFKPHNKRLNEFLGTNFDWN